VPLRDFVVDGKWVGGSRQRYGDWEGTLDLGALGEIRKAGFAGKVGLRDWFLYRGEAYYLY
jgi:hypothetical protein